MKIKIGIFGSSSHSSIDVQEIAKSLGAVLGKYPDDVVIVTGGSTGLPHDVAKEASKYGVEVIGFSPARNEKEQRELLGDEVSVYSSFVYSQETGGTTDRVRMKLRNVRSTAYCDAGIIISGRWGSLNEFTNLIDMQKLVGVLTGTGGTADILEKLMQKISKDGQGEVFFDSNPEKLVSMLIMQLKIKD